MRLSLALLLLCASLPAAQSASPDSVPSVTSTQYASIQAAIDANPGKMVYIPAGEHRIDAALTIETTGTGLFGPGRIVQTNPGQSFLRIRNTSQVRIRDLVFARPANAMETTQEGIAADDSSLVEIDGVQVLDNRGPGGSIVLRKCVNSTVRDCLVLNYKAPAIDDRTGTSFYGYAFKCIDGTGLKAFNCDGTQILNNRFIENVFLPEKAMHDRYELGKVTIMPEKRRELMPQSIFDTGYTNNWHQGSGLIVGGLGMSSYTIISGNYIENAGQGMDLHADNVIVSNNLVNGAMIGMKAMHGSRNVLIANNQFARMDLWGLMLMPGTASHAATPASEGKEALEQNIDGGTVVANNIFSRFGEGGGAWNYPSGKPDEAELNMIALQGSPQSHNPPLRDVVITGNVVYNSGRDAELVDGKPETREPGYRYAIYIEPDDRSGPQGVKIYNNIFHAGRKGISNVNLEQYGQN